MGLGGGLDARTLLETLDFTALFMKDQKQPKCSRTKKRPIAASSVDAAYTCPDVNRETRTQITAFFKI